MSRRLRRLVTRLDARWIVPLGVALVLSIVLAWWRPWQGPNPARPQTVALVPTSTATATRVPERIALPGATPTRPVASVATPAIAASPAPAAPRAPGMLLYSGYLAGRQGIIAARADGRELWLVAEGQYSQIAWSPTSDRFAAIGRLEERTFQVAIFASDGRALARYPFSGAVDSLLWSPDGTMLASAARTSAQTSSAQIDVWLLAGQREPQRVNLPEHRQVFPLAWTREGHLAIAGYDTVGNEYSLWVVSADGRNVVRATNGVFLPFGVTGDGGTAIVASGLAADPSSGTPDPILPTTIVAIDLRTDERRTVMDAVQLGLRVFGAADGARSTTFATGLVAPGGDHLALVVARGAAAGTPQFGVREESALVFVRLDGTVTGVVSLAADARRGLASWSPDGTLLATYVFNFVSNDYAIQIFDSGGTLRGLYNVNGPGIGAVLAPAWSPDGRWFAYVGPGGLTIASMDGYPPYAIAASGDFPAWRP